jgi:cytochrome bd-type quinol oxidase subunit 2
MRWLPTNRRIGWPKASELGDILSYLFVGLVVVGWVYAGYRVVSVSDRKHATLRYVSPLLLLAIALIVYALWPTEAGASDDTANMIWVWVLPPAVMVLVAAVAIDRRRAAEDG